MNTPADLAAVKARQQATWASGDFSESPRTSSRGRAPRRRRRPAGRRARARRRHRQRQRRPRRRPPLLRRSTGSTTSQRCSTAAASRAGPSACRRLRRGDAEDAAVPRDVLRRGDVVFGTMFAPDHERTAAELARVCRPGGTIGAGQLDAGGLPRRCSGPSAARPAAGRGPSPMLWGTEEHLAEIFAGTVEWTAHERRIFSSAIPPRRPSSTSSHLLRADAEGGRGPGRRR